MADFERINMLSIFILLLNFHSLVSGAPTLEKLMLPGVQGPESIVFDRKGRGPYASVADGRILKYEGPRFGFVDYGYASPKRTKAFCDGVNSTDLIPTCGRPLGLGFYYATGELYVCDASYGLAVIGPKGGLGTQIATSANGVPFRLADGVEVDQSNGVVYFTDASAVYRWSQLETQTFDPNDATGRLLKYDPRTKKVTVLLSGLAGASGIALSKDGSYIILTEFLQNRVKKLWLKGPKAHKLELIIPDTKGIPDKVIRTAAGDFLGVSNFKFRATNS